MLGFIHYGKTILKLKKLYSFNYFNKWKKNLIRKNIILYKDICSNNTTI